LARALSDVVHAINNSLQVMSGSAELLEGRLAADPVACQRLQAIRAQAERAAATVTDLLAYSRGGGADRRPTDINRLLDVAVAMRAHSLSRLRILTSRDAPTGDRVLGLVPPNGCLQLLLNALLLLEARVAGRERASIAMTSTVSGPTVCVRLQGGGTGWDDVPWGGAEPSVRGPHWRVMEVLAAAMEGTAALVEADGAPGIALTFPAAGATRA